jgi:hypothetical protein
MGEIKSPTLLWIKAGLFVTIGLVAAVLLILERPTLKVGLLLSLAIWAFCRAYYFAFYVIHHYADPEYRYSGLFSLLRYVCRSRDGR